MSSNSDLCPTCGSALPSAASQCPYCRAPHTFFLARSAGADAIDRHVEERLARLHTDDLLAKVDSIDSLMAPLLADARAGVAPGELYGALSRVVEAEVPSLERLESLLSLDNSDVSVEGVNLLALIEPSGGGRQILRRGFLFLKHRRYGEATEYWALHREGLSAGQGRLDLLLLLLEAFTFRLAGNQARAEAARQAIAKHPSLPRGRKNLQPGNMP